MAITAQAYFVSSRGSSFVGWRGALLVSVPKKMVFVAASYDGVDQTVLVAGPKWKTCSPQLSLIVIGGSSGSGFGPTSYFHAILPVLRLERDDEAAAGAGLVLRVVRVPLLERAAGEDDLAVGQDRRREGAVERVRVGERLGRACRPSTAPCRFAGRGRRGSRRGRRSRPRRRSRARSRRRRATALPSSRYSCAAGLAWRVDTTTSACRRDEEL